MFMLKSTHDYFVSIVQARYTDYIETISRLRKEIEELKTSKEPEVNNDQIDLFIEEAETASVVIDWAGMNVVSIERAVNEHNCVETVVGYLPDGCTTVQEWFIQCNIEGHESLVVEFEEYLVNRK